MRTRATLVAALLVGTLAACAGARGPAAGETFDSLPDGDHSGYVVGFDGQAITFDPAEMLPDDTAPNGFRIDDPDDAVLILAVAPSARVALIDGFTVQHRDINLRTFAAFLDGDRPGWAYGSPEHFLATIEVRDDRVTGIEETYLP